MGVALHVVLDAIRSVVCGIPRNPITCRNWYSQVVVAVCKVVQRSLHPRPQETFEANFWSGSANLREHLLEHRFFQRHQLVMLPLMQTNQPIQLSEITTDFDLFGAYSRNCEWSDFCLLDCIVSNCSNVTYAFDISSKGLR